MKRSEAVQLLRDIVLNHMNCECCSTDEEMYATMLKDIEDKIGMLPPFNAPLFYNIWRDNGDAHKWEKEDEQEKV